MLGVGERRVPHTHINKKIPQENSTASPQSIQYMTIITSLSHFPVAPTPYWLTLMRIVPKLMTSAGTKRDSVGCFKLAEKVKGYK